uniref:Uncharacterized protein n=1 Tax=Ditylenchus dipsaci TaxID=166011 RepID=A0A915DHF0_9BILA
MKPWPTTNQNSRATEHAIILQRIYSKCPGRNFKTIEKITLYLAFFINVILLFHRADTHPGMKMTHRLITDTLAESFICFLQHLASSSPHFSMHSCLLMLCFLPHVKSYSPVSHPQSPTTYLNHNDDSSGCLFIHCVGVQFLPQISTFKTTRKEGPRQKVPLHAHCFIYHFYAGNVIRHFLFLLRDRNPVSHHARSDHRRFRRAQRSAGSATEKLESSCFICDIGKETFDRMPRGFENHVAKEHNFANYLFFLQHLVTKMKQSTPVRRHLCARNMTTGIGNFSRWANVS